jgi:hypothetical protein
MGHRVIHSPSVNFSADPCRLSPAGICIWAVLFAQRADIGGEVSRLVPAQRKFGIAGCGSSRKNATFSGPKSDLAIVVTIIRNMIPENAGGLSGGEVPQEP